MKCTIILAEQKKNNMIEISSTEAKQDFGAFLDKGSREIVVVKRHNRKVGAFVPMSELAKLRKLQAEELHNAALAISEEAEANGLTEEVLRKILAQVNPS
jgi:hypothetical protein